MSKIEITLKNGNKKELLPSSQLTQERWRYVVVFVNGVDDLTPYLGSVAVNDDNSIELVNLLGVTTVWLNRENIYGFYYTEPVGLEINYTRRAKGDKNAPFLTYDKTVLDYCPNVEDYFDALEERSESRSRESELFEYSWNTRPIFEEDEWL